MDSKRPPRSRSLTMVSAVFGPTPRMARNSSTVALFTSSACAGWTAMARPAANASRPNGALASAFAGGAACAAR